MSNSQQFALPDVGEGLTEAEIVTWYVAVGDQVAVNDTLVDIETAKSVVELPSPFAGIVQQILAEPGATVAVGDPLVVIGDGVAAAPHAKAAAPTATSDTTPPEPEPAPSVSDATDEKRQVLVGPGPKEASARRRHLGRAQRPEVRGVGGSLARTIPPVRRLARELGVDLDALAGAGHRLISEDDVRRAASPSQAGVVNPPDMFSAPPSASIAGGQPRETRIAIKGVRKVSAGAVTRSAFTAPHVSEWLTVDITGSMDLVRRLKADRAWAGVRITPLTVVARAFLAAVRAFPAINATWDADNDEIVVKHYVNLGIAAATPRGLLVPNIKDAHAMDLRALAHSLDDLVTTARAGKTQPRDMARGTVSITNIGALGVDAGTPILNPGESAILAFGAVRKQPWVVGDQISVREVTQLAMSFDHRLVDGELGSRVLARTGELLADPGAALLYL